MSSIPIATDVASRSHPMTREEKSVILASSAGTVFEWYPVVIALMTVLIGIFFVPETYKRDIFKA